MFEDEKELLDLAFFKQLCQFAPFGVTIYDSDLNCVYFNKHSADLFELNPENTLGKNLLEIVPGFEKTDRHEKFCETLETGKPNNVYFCKKSKIDSEVTICFDIKILKIEDKLALIIEDVTQEKYLEHQKNVRLDTLLLNIPANIFFKDMELKYTFVNKGAQEFLEMDFDQIIGKTDFDLFDHELAEKTRKEDTKILEKGISFVDVEDPHRSKSGDVVWFSTTKIPLKDINGNITGIMGMSFDITTRKMVESEVELLIATMHQTSEAIVITDKDGIIQYVNPAFVNVTGYSIEEAVGENPSILQSGKHDPEFYDELWDTLKKGNSWHGHFVNKRKNGSIYEEDANISPIRNIDGEITNYVAVKKDVTNEKTLESQLMQSQKMESIGRLAGGIAHDFNNILTAILGYSELLLMGMEDSDPRRSKVEEINKAGKRASELTKQMLAFSKKQVVENRPLDVNKTINEMSGMLTRIIGENIKLELELDENLDEIKSDKGQLEQVLMNLVVNAGDAVPIKEGKIKISTENFSRETEFKNGNFEAPPGDYVRISVQDNGHGIGEDTIDQIFEPFFTRKKQKGTGLGLSTVYGIVRQHNGYIEIFSTVGKGTIFDICFPVSIEKSKHDATAHGIEINEIFEGDVLLVEDEPPVLNLAASILNLNGFNVVTAENGEDALKLFDSGKNSFKLLVSDVVLPGITGKELSDILINKKPDLKIIFMSGYAGESLNGLNVDSGKFNFIPKPFSMESFSTIIRKTMKGTVVPEE